jgi:hypothetical protein
MSHLPLCLSQKPWHNDTGLRVGVHGLCEFIIKAIIEILKTKYKYVSLCWAFQTMQASPGNEP